MGGRVWEGGGGIKFAIKPTFFFCFYLIPSGGAHIFTADAGRSV